MELDFGYVLFMMMFLLFVVLFNVVFFKLVVFLLLLCNLVWYEIVGICNCRVELGWGRKNRLLLVWRMVVVVVVVDGSLVLIGL